MKRKKRSLVVSDKTGVEEAEINEYYISCSRVFMTIKYVLLVILAIFVVVMLAVYRSSITYDNLAYLLRDFGTEYSSGAAVFSDLRYDEQENMDFALYKSELAVAGDKKITLYNSASSKTFEYDSDMDNPVLECSDKYMLAYDLGGKNYSVFTNLTRVYNVQGDSVIENASVSDSGEYLLICRARDSKYTVSYYNSSFENEANYYKSNYVSDASISPDGSMIAIASVGIKGNDFDSVIEFYKRGDENSISEYRAGNLLPVNTGTFKNGYFYVICDKKILFFDDKGEFVSEYNSDRKKISAVSVYENTLTAVLSQNEVNDLSSIILFDNGGNIGYNIEIDCNVTDISHNDKYIYLLGAGKVFRCDYNTSDSNPEDVRCDVGVQYIIQDGDYVIAGDKTSAVGLFVNNG